MRLFVYGTLMKGEGNHSMMEGCKFIRPAKTQPWYTLISLGAFPGLVDGGHTSIRGEVYEVPESRLLVLDRFEGVPYLYRRLPVSLSVGGAEAYFVAFARNTVNVIESGDWRRR